MVDWFKEKFYAFTCENPQCGEGFEQILGSLVEVDEVVCPKCATTIDIRESKRHGDIAHDFDTANELLKPDRKKK